MHLSSTGNFLYKPKNPYSFPSQLFSLVLMIALLKKKIKLFFYSIILKRKLRKNRKKLYNFYKTLEDRQIF